MNSIKQVFLIALFGLTLSAIQAQSPTVLNIGGEQVSLEEFENIFKKNNRTEKVTKESLDEYIELFINFKLKVLEAKALGMDTSKAFKRELKGYRSQLARPYLTDSDMLDELVIEAYERKKWEVKAAHILIGCKENASPEDTLIAFNKITDVRAQIKAGADFTTIAKQNSEDPSVKQNGGELGYFSAFQMVYPFEEAAYTTEVGDVSTPIRTRFGYHILKVEDKRPARGELRAAHIMVKVKNKKDDAPEIQKINEIYGELQQGTSFADLALRYSDDVSTKKKGGELPWFGSGKMIEEFENQAFALKNDGDYSEPFRTEHGWFLVKRLEYRAVATFEETKKDLKSKVSRDKRSEVTKDRFIEKLKKEYNFKMDNKLQAKLKAGAGENFETGKIDVQSSVLDKELFSVDNLSFSGHDFVASLNTKPSKSKTKTAPSTSFDKQMKAFINQSILDIEDTKLEGKHSAFRLLINEYRDGILLFELTDEIVWSKAVKDTVGLKKYYNNHKNDYIQEEQAEVTIYSCNDSKMAKKVKKLASDGINSREIETEINKESALNVVITNGKFTVDEKEILTKTDMKKGVVGPLEMDSQFHIINIINIIEKHTKELSETRGLVTADYQNQLEKDWINSLRNKFDYEVDTNVLYKIID